MYGHLSWRFNYNRLAAEKISREALEQSLSGIPAQLAAMQSQIDEQATDAALGDDIIWEKLDIVAALATAAAPVTDSTVASECGGGGCSAPQISTSGQDMLIEAPGGSVGIFSQECNAGVDVCQLAKLAAQLKKALANMTAGDA